MEIFSDLGEILSEDQLRQVISLFIQHTDERLQQLTEAAANRDKDSIESIAHSIKGSSANMGAKNLSAISNEILEEVRKTGIPENIGSRIGEAKREFDEVKGFFAKELEKFDL